MRSTEVAEPGGFEIDNQLPRLGYRGRSAIGVKMKHLAAMIALVTFVAQLGIAQERSISGRVVDAEGKPVANVSVATFWRANGSAKRRDGTEFDVQDKAQLREYWGRLGQMEPNDSMETKGDGTFTISLRSRDRALFAMTSDRNYGCITEVPEDSDATATVVMQLTRLVTVKAEFWSSVKDKSFDWCHAYVELLPDEKYPLANNRLISCGSFDRRFEVRLPPGNYQLDAYGVTDSVADIIDLRVNPAPNSQFAVRTPNWISER